MERHLYRREQQLQKHLIALIRLGGSAQQVMAL
jgi:hypothetical protein